MHSSRKFKESDPSSFKQTRSTFDPWHELFFKNDLNSLVCLAPILTTRTHPESAEEKIYGKTLIMEVEPKRDETK